MRRCTLILAVTLTSGWVLQGQPFALTEIHVVNNTINFSRPPGAFQTTFPTGSHPLGLLWRTLNLRAASTYRLRYVRPDLAVVLDSGPVDTRSVAPPNDYSFIHWFTPNLSIAGIWHINLYINEILVASPQFEVIEPGSPPRGLIHRYSFTNGAGDSVGGANGVLVNGPPVKGGAVHLDGVNQYVALPGGIISTLTSATLEAWVTWAEFQAPWSRIWDLGSSAANSMFLTPRNGRFDSGPAVDTTRFAITTSGVAGEQQANSASPFPVGSPVHAVVTLDSATHTGKLYIDGNLAAVNTDLTLTPATLGTTTNNWLGRSQYADPYFKGEISEFRIYDRALSDAEIQADFAAGPDGGVTPPPGNGCGASDVTSQIATVSSGYLPFPPMFTLFAENITIQNTGPTLPGPLYVIPRGIPTQTTGLVGVYPGAGRTTCYTPSGEDLLPLPGGSLASGASAKFTLYFTTRGGWPSPHSVTLLSGKPNF